MLGSISLSRVVVEPIKQITLSSEVFSLCLAMFRCLQNHGQIQEHRELDRYIYRGRAGTWVIVVVPFVMSYLGVSIPELVQDSNKGQELVT